MSARAPRLRLAAACAVLLAIGAGLLAALDRPADPPAPVQAPRAGKVVLTVFHQDRQVPFDMRSLEALPQVTHRLQTPWYLRKVAFQGPLLRDVLAAAAAGGTRIAAVAINDYTAEIPFSDVLEHEVIVAVRMDGKPLSPRDKGPLFIVYPYDRLPAADLPRYQDMSVWQLDVLKVR